MTKLIYDSYGASAEIKAHNSSRFWPSLIQPYKAASRGDARPLWQDEMTGG